MRALSHALATGRLHHAWLFTGTRGVGKTTISRILAKALNCEKGVTAEPCGVCSACTAIDADRFPDYVEMDAASNRGVEDMAALLDQAVYAPVQGRFKVYMIDEVHMLTGHAFNAMLKTLEEPPAHVKFILATTDPQKIPVTVLSRCLQFNLKQMPPGLIVEHLGQILEAESIPFEAAALRHVARAASGSMRDALSLLDQTIAHGAGRVEEAQVTLMLGTVGDDHLHAVLDALQAADVPALLAVADDMESRSLSFDAALQTLASLFHRIALLQFAPTAVSDESERTRLLAYAQVFEPEFLQLAYQIVTHGRSELTLAPDEYAGFTMCLLRLAAFRPEQPAPLGGDGAEGPPGASGRVRGLAPVVAPGIVPAASATQAASGATNSTATLVAANPVESAGSECQLTALASTPDEVPPWMELPAEALEGLASARTPESDRPHADVARPLTAALPGTAKEVARTPCDDLASLLQQGHWHAVLERLELGGMVRELAQHCEWLALSETVLRLRLSHRHRHLHDLSPDLADRLADVLSSRIGKVLALRIEIGEIAGETPAQKIAAERDRRMAEAVALLEQDPFVRELIERFDATLDEASVKPL